MPSGCLEARRYQGHAKLTSWDIGVCTASQKSAPIKPLCVAARLCCGRGANTHSRKNLHQQYFQGWPLSRRLRAPSRELMVAFENTTIPLLAVAALSCCHTAEGAGRVSKPLTTCAHALTPSSHFLNPEHIYHLYLDVLLIYVCRDFRSLQILSFTSLHGRCQCCLKQQGVSISWSVGSEPNGTLLQLLWLLLLNDAELALECPQLIHKASVGPHSCPPLLYKAQSFVSGPHLLAHQVRNHHCGTARLAGLAMDKDAALFQTLIDERRASFKMSI
mmetsp:Transcript_10891/g.20434  ORF Transcript_10891/g.20434 Transcript_10891/m.20434 type:complete len:275 (-) Transcript_10891:437-1261(-)